MFTSGHLFPPDLRSFRLSLRFLISVFTAALAAFLYTTGIQRSANDVITNAGQIFNTTAADQYYRVLLQVMPFTRNVGSDLNTVA